MGYLLKNPNQIITAKVLLSSANLLTPGYIFDIPEYPKVDGYFWNVIYMNGEIINGTTPYSGTSAIHIQAASVPNAQFRFPGAYMGAALGTWSIASNSGGGVTQFSANDKLQIHNPSTLTLGNTELMIYIGANLIKY